MVSFGVMKHFDFTLLFQFASKGVRQNIPMTGRTKFRVVTMRIEAHTIAR